MNLLSNYELWSRLNALSSQGAQPAAMSTPSQDRMNALSPMQPQFGPIPPRPAPDAYSDDIFRHPADPAARNSLLFDQMKIFDPGEVQDQMNLQLRLHAPSQYYGRQTF